MKTDSDTIVVVGGGSAGGMTAYTLKKIFPHKTITIIESKAIPTTGVGESTLGQINQWLALLGIEDKDFMKECDASYKLGIRFEDFYQKGDRGFYYPFGFPAIKENRSLLNDWYFKKFLYPETSNKDYADCLYPAMALINQNKITDDLKFPNWSLKNDVAYHFDAIKFGNWLKKEFKKLGGKIEIGSIVKINQDTKGITSLDLDTDKSISADLYIDCSGFKSLLLGQTLKEPFESYSNILPNNSAWATHLPYQSKEKELKPYTNCTAIENGWVWNIPLWSKMGTGYVYSDKYISDDDALKQFKKYLGQEDLEFKKLKMRTGIHKNIWVKNVCAIGLSAGFIEPLESNGLLSVHEFLEKLLRVLQRPVISTFIKQQFNFSCRNLFNSFAEFVALHYALSVRTDTPYWQDIQKKNYPFNEKLLQVDGDFQKLAFNKFAHFHYPPDGGIDCIATGMNWYATDLTAVMYNLRTNDLKELQKKWQPAIDRLNKRKKEWNSLAHFCPSLFDYLKKNIYKCN